MARRRRVKRQKAAYPPPSARGRTLVQESLPGEAARHGLRHSAEDQPQVAPAPKKATPKAAAPKKAAPKKAVAPKKAAAPKVEKKAAAPVKKVEEKSAPKIEKGVFIDPKRARADGKFVADDPATPDKNEAWEGGKAPAPKKAAPKWNVDMTKKELVKFLPKKSKLTSKSSKDAILKELGG